MEIHKVTDREIEICGWALENETEGCVKLAIQMQLALLMEIRNENKKPLIQKIKEKIFGLPKVKKQKVYTTPTGNKKDIIVGSEDVTHTCRGDYKGKCKCADKEPEEPKVRTITEGSESKGGVGKKPSGKRPNPPVGQKTKSRKKKRG